MRRDETIRALKQHGEELTQDFGVTSLALFGSVARDEATEVSDVDLLIELDGRPVGLFHLAKLHARLCELLHVKHVDLVLRDSIDPALEEDILGEAVDVYATEVGTAH
jgi:predicted nucleotidyltransferase